MVRIMLRNAETIAMVEDLVGRANLAMITTLNASAHEILRQSEKVVPKGDQAAHEARLARAHGGMYPEQQLFESGKVIDATPESHVAQIVYDSPYAAAQEVGLMTYESKGGKEVEWAATNYTTPGTGPHYLEDSAKLVLPQVPEELAMQGRIAFGGIIG